MVTLKACDRRLVAERSIQPDGTGFSPVHHDQLLVVPKNRIITTAAFSRNLDSLFEFRSIINEGCSFQQTSYCISACLCRIFASPASKTLCLVPLLFRRISVESSFYSCTSTLLLVRVSQNTALKHTRNSLKSFDLSIVTCT